MKGTQRAKIEALDRPVVVPLEDIEVGDVLEFEGAGDHSGRRFGTVSKMFPRLRVLRLERKTTGPNGKEFLHWRTTVHETRVLRNLTTEEAFESIGPVEEAEQAGRQGK